MRRRVPVVASVLFGAAAAAAAVGSRPRLRRLLRRWGTLIVLGGRTTSRAAAHNLRRLGVEPHRRQELDVAFEMRSAEDVAATLGQMKGTFMKVGQLLSFVDDAMPEHVRAALSQLQDS